MMNMQSLTVSMILIVLSLVHINASKYQSPRQTGVSQCPPVNLCDYVKCENGVCIENKTSIDCYQCQCSTGFTGSLCETQISGQTGCTSPCLNGGSCEQTNTNTYVCVCPSNFTGNQCETSLLAITTCDSNPCGAHGTCAQVILPSGQLTILCRCEPEWTGTYCDVNQTGSTVTATVITMTTTTGIFSNTSTSTTGPTTGRCTASSCLNGGSCYNTGNDFICLCKPQFSGPTCALQSPVTTPNPTTPSTTNPCSPNPCQNGGSCFKHGNSFVCVCSSQYTGQICDTAKTTATPSITTPSTTLTCANQPCQNGATCYNAGSSYFCYCGTGSNYTGKNCDTAIPTSDSIDCSPGYSVSSGSNQNPTVCMCPDGTLTPNSCSSK